MITRYSEDGRPIIAPQAGPQEMFCASTADIVIYGGQAFGGKSVCLLLEGGRNVGEPRYTGVIFRRKYTEIVQGGGLWDTSSEIYPSFGGVGVRGNTEWTFPAKCRLKMTHLNNEKNVYDHQGAAYVFIGFDELTHFTEHQFFYLLSRNRPPAGCMLKCYVRATCNAEPGWVADLIAWWWDPNTGYAIPERSGVIRHFIRKDNKIVWVSASYRDEYGLPPKSLTFISSSMNDNPIGLLSSPEYRANINAMDYVSRERLGKGNWLIEFGGNMFRMEWFRYADSLPEGIKLVRYWDFAATEVKEEDKADPDWTAGALCGIHENVLYIADISFFRESPGTTEKKVKATAELDGHAVEVWWEEEKGSSGRFTSEYMRQVLKGYDAHPDPVSGQKVERAKPWSAWAEFGRVVLIRGDWNRQFLSWASKFPDGKRDTIDSVSGAFKVLTGPDRVFKYYVSDDAGNFRTFQRDKEDFEKITKGNIEVFVSLWADDIGGIYGGCYLWSKVAKRLRLYNEIIHPEPIAGVLAYDIIEKLIVPIHEKEHFVTLNKIYCNDKMFEPGKASMSKELKKYGIRLHPNKIYEEAGAIMQMNRMMAENSFWVHTDCVESDVEFRGMMYENKKPQPGFSLARSALQLISQLRSEMQLQSTYKAPPYSRSKINIRENLRVKSNYDPVGDVITGKEHDYLIK